MMDKYISVEDLEQSFEISDSLSHARAYGHVNEVIKNAQPMVSVSDIKEIINKYTGKVCGSGINMQNELNELITPQPELFGGLSNKDWKRLNYFFMVNVETITKVKENLVNVGSLNFSSITLLLPDQENHIRYHNGNNINPLPDNIEIEVYYHFREPYKKLSQNVNWRSSFGYRILRVVNNDN